MKLLPNRMMAAMAAVLGMVPAPSVAAEPQFFGLWVVMENPTRLRGECLLVNLLPDGGKRLGAALDGKGDLELVISDPSFALEKLTEPGGRKAKLMVNGKTYDDVELWSSNDRESVNVIRYDANRNTISLEPDLLQDSKLQITSAHLNATFQIVGASKALDAFYACNKDGWRNRPQASAQLDPFTGGRLSSQTPVPGLGSGGSSVAGNGSADDASGVGSEAERLGRAMQGMGSRAPVLAQFTCYVTGSELYGMADINGRDDADPMVINVAEDGVGEMNGRALQPAYVEGVGSGSTTLMAVYPLKEVTAAMMGSPEHAAPPLVNMSSSELQAYRAALGYMQGIGDQMMAGRNRYMVVSLAENVVRFLDLTPQNQAVNVATPQCGRTM